ncbi:MAG: hypothetical protein AAF742_03440 [Pseudomonadota bacterium]
MADEPSAVTSPSSDEVLSVFDRIRLSKEQKQSQKTPEPVSPSTYQVEERPDQDNTNQAPIAEKPNGMPTDPEALSEALSNVASAIKQAHVGSSLEQDEHPAIGEEVSNDAPPADTVSPLETNTGFEEEESNAEHSESTELANPSTELASPADVQADETVPEEPQSTDGNAEQNKSPDIEEKVRLALRKSLKATQADLQTAYDQIAEVRTKIVDAENERKESHDEVSARIKRAEAIISELRDAWK